MRLGLMNIDGHGVFDGRYWIDWDWFVWCCDLISLRSGYEDWRVGIDLMDREIFLVFIRDVRIFEKLRLVKLVEIVVMGGEGWGLFFWGCRIFIFIFFIGFVNAINRFYRFEMIHFITLIDQFMILTLLKRVINLWYHFSISWFIFRIFYLINFILRQINFFIVEFFS